MPEWAFHPVFLRETDAAEPTRVRDISCKSVLKLLTVEMNCAGELVRHTWGTEQSIKDFSKLPFKKSEIIGWIRYAG